MKYDFEKQQKLAVHKLNICNFKLSEHKNFEEDLIETLEKAYNFAFLEYQDEYEEWAGRYEWNTAISGFINDLIMLWENNPQIAQSEKIKEHLFELLKKDSKWLYSKDYVIYILMLFGDSERIFRAGKEITELWKGTEFLQYRLIEAIYKLKISGFRQEFLAMQQVAEQQGDKKMQRYIVNYLKNEKL